MGRSDLDCVDDIAMSIFNKKIVVTVAACCLLAILPRPASAELVTDVTISGLTTLSEDAVLDLVSIKSGDEFSLSIIDNAIKYLRRWGVFDEIEVNPSRGPSGVSINFKLKEATVITAIEVVNNYPYLENKVLKYLSVHAGDIYTPERVADQIARIKEFYTREGYIGTGVYAEERVRPEIGGVDLIFHIKSGGVLRYGTIEMEGNQAYPDGRFVSAINPMRPYSEPRLRDSIRRLVEFYKGEGYPKVRIKVSKKEYDFEARRVSLKLNITEGPKVDIRFDGAPRTAMRALKDAVTFFDEGSVDSFEVESSIDAMKKVLEERGYFDANISAAKSVNSDGTIVFTFTIDRGESRLIRKVSFIGNGDVSRGDISQVMHNRKASIGDRGVYKPNMIDEDKINVEKVMQRGGYLNAKVGEWGIGLSPKGYAFDIAVPIDHGDKYLVGGVDFLGNKGIAKERLLHELKIVRGTPFNKTDLPNDHQRLITFYADNGYPYASIDQSWDIVDESSKKVGIRYLINEGPFVKIGRIYFIGDITTSQRALRKAISIKEGDPYSYRKVIESELNIRRMGPFAAVSIEAMGIEEKKDVIHLRVKVEEQKPYMIDLSFGYSTDNQYTGSLVFTNLNAFGWAKSNSLKLVAGRELTRAELGWYDPRFLGSSFEMSVNGWTQYKEEPAYRYMQLGSSLGWFRRLQRFSFFMRYELDRNYFIEGDPVAADDDSMRNNTLSKTSLSASYDSRDSYSDPRRGFFVMSGGDLFNEIKGRKANFASISLKGEYDRSAGSWVTISNVARFDRIFGLGSNVSIPTHELLFMGGDDTVRGFEEDYIGPRKADGTPAGARLRILVNEEVRLRIWDNISCAFFYDMGSLTDDFSDISESSIRNSAGVGLRLGTPVGPIRADYGFKIDRKDNEPLGRFHLTFGYVF